MKPTKITYHYSFKDLRKFIQMGRESGDVGCILLKSENNLLTYKGFGTIEHPCKTLTKITMMYNPIFDGKLSSYSFHIFDTDERKI